MLTGPAEAAAADVHAWAEAAERLACAAAARIRQGTAVSAIEKAPGDWASALDAEIEAQLRAEVARAFPEHGFWGEESHDPVVASALMTGAAPVWVVDPIDGSLNFLRGYPQYAVSVAVLQRGEPVAGCIVDPVRGEVFRAALGAGATLNGQRLQVAPTARLDSAIAATVFPKPNAPFMIDYLETFGRVIRATGGVRRAGSMALELAYLAAGRVDVFWERGMGAWDAAAGVLLIREAGGAVWSLDGLPWWQADALAAATPSLAGAWGDLLQPEPSPNSNRAA